MENAKISCIKIKPFDDEHRSLGAWAFIPKDVVGMKEANPAEYQRHINDIAEEVKSFVAEEVKNHMHVVIRDEEVEGDVKTAATVGVKINVY